MPEEHSRHHHDEPAAPIPAEYQATCPVTGDTTDIREAEKLGHVRRYNGKKISLCCATCVQLFDKNPSKYMGHQHHTVQLKLIEKENLVDNVWAFRFEPNAPVTWVPGQFMRVELDHDNPDEEGTKRWFTISSAPYEEIVQITTRVTDSTFKQALNALSVGSQIDMIEAPDGDFIWEESERPLVFVAGGIGITPFRSILKQRAHDNLPLDVTLIYGNRTDALVSRDEFDSYTVQDRGFKVQYVTGEPITAAKLAEIRPALNSALVYISGPEPMVETLGDELKAVYLPESQLKQDFFPNYDETNY